MSGRMGPLKVIRDRGQDRTRPSPFRDVAARPSTPATRGLPPVARGRARRGALREDRDHGRILRRHRADLEAPRPEAPQKRPNLPTHIEIRGEMGYYRSLLTAVQMKAEAAEYYRKLAPTAENRYIRTFLQILANREEEQRDILADMLDAQRGTGFSRTKSGKIIPTTPTWLGMYLLDDVEE